MKNCLFTLVFLISITTANSQIPDLDSLKRSLAVAREDTTRVLLLAELSLWSVLSKPDTSLALAKEGIRLAQQINYSKGEAYCKRSVGFFFWSIGDYTTAIKLAFSGMPYAEASNDIGLQRWLNDLLLNAYRDNGDYNEAIKYDLKNRMTSQKLNEPISGKRESMSASIYYDMNQLDSAQHYIRLSLNKGGMVDGAICLTMGNIQAKLQQPDSAFYYYMLGIAKLTKAKNFKGLANAYQSIAALYFSDGHTDSAIYYAKNGLSLAQQKSFVKEQFYLTSFMAEAYGKKNTDSAFQYYKLAMVAKDSLFNREKAKQILSFQFNEELRQREIKTTETEYRNKVRTDVFIAGLAVFVVIAVLQWRNNRHKQRAYNLLEKQKAKTDEVLTDLKATQSQLIQSEKMASFNKLQQAMLKERLRISRELHDDIGSTLSGIVLYSHMMESQVHTQRPGEMENSVSKIQRSAKNMVTRLNDLVWAVNPEQNSLKNLMQKLEDYAVEMAIVKNIKVRMNVPGNLAELQLPAESMHNIYLVCKEAINNAVKYSQASLLEISLHQFDHTIKFSIIDNGKGFDMASVKKGNGLRNMCKRADEALAILSVQSTPHEGTIISLECKIT